MENELEATANSDSDINDLFNQNYIDIAIISSYFDFEDYENPIHYYLEDMNVFNLIPSLGLQVQYQVRQNQAVMNDDILLGSQGHSNEVNFYSIDRKRISYSTIGFNNSYLQVFISLDPQIDQYQRTVYCFFDMFGFIGGIFGLFKTFGYLLVCYFIEKAYYSSIISKLYHVEAELDEKQHESQAENFVILEGNIQNSTIQKPMTNGSPPKMCESNPSILTSIQKNLQEEQKFDSNFIGSAKNKT